MGSAKTETEKKNPTDSGEKKNATSLESSKDLIGARANKDRVLEESDRKQQNKESEKLIGPQSPIEMGAKPPVDPETPAAKPVPRTQTELSAIKSVPTGASKPDLKPDMKVERLVSPKSASENKDKLPANRRGTEESELQSKPLKTSSHQQESDAEKVQPVLKPEALAALVSPTKDGSAKDPLSTKPAVEPSPETDLGSEVTAPKSE